MLTCWATTTPRGRSLESPSFHYSHKITVSIYAANFIESCQIIGIVVY